MAETTEFISKGRLDALPDGVFAFAMTLLVVNLDLPEDFHPSSAAELISALLGLGGTLIAYVVTFSVLATFWLARARTRDPAGRRPDLRGGPRRPDRRRRRCRSAPPPRGPGRHRRGDRGRGVPVIERDIQRRLVPSGRPEYGVLIASAILSMAIGFYRPDSAMYAYFLNLASPLVRRWTERV